MPIYEYECSECGVRFDRLQRFGDPAPETCPNGHSRLRRLLPQPTIIFKGSGFYVTDHGRNGHGKSSRKRHKDGDTETTSTPNTEKPASS